MRETFRGRNGLHRLVLMGSLLAAPFSLGSDYGTTGLIDVPTARMQQDGYLTFGAGFDGLHRSFSATYQATPWLEATFRYSGTQGASSATANGVYWDRNYAFKALLVDETDLLPALAVGVRDAVGTGVFSSEYLVGTKKYGPLDITVGIGWGRLAGNGLFKNPLELLDPAFGVRRNTRGLADTGTFNNTFLRGRIGAFGGLRYSLPHNFGDLLIEYNSDQYKFANRIRANNFRPETPISLGFEWSPFPGVYVGLSHQHGDEVGFSIRSVLDTKALPPNREKPSFISSMYLPQKELPTQIDKSRWYDRLLYDVERSGLILVEGDVSPDGKNAEIVVGNANYSLWSSALSRHIALADLHLPASVETIYIVTEEGGHRSATLIIPRPSAQKANIDSIPRVRLVSGRTLTDPKHRTGFVTGNIISEVSVGTRFQLFDPDDPARYQFYLNVSSEYVLGSHWSVRSKYSLDIENNFGESRRLNSDSQLPNVRTGVVRYLTEGATGLDSLFIEGRDTYGSNLHYRAFGGILEEMYSGVGGEVLYWPSKSRFAIGASLAYVKQRDFDKSLKHLDYEVLTGFVSGYWATPWHNFDAAIHIGRYLARDFGATLDIRRTFRNGWQVGLFATLTDVPFEVFGEGSFDKGFYFQVPIDGLFGNRTRSNISARIRPVLRDGGQRLEGHSGNIFWDLRQARFDALVVDEALVK